MAEEEQKEELPFPKATVVRLIRKNLDENKMIRKRVKREMNKWLGEMCAKASDKMNESRYTYISYEDFRKATKIFNDLGEMKKEKNRIVAHLEKIKEDCNSLIRDLNKKFEGTEEDQTSSTT